MALSQLQTQQLVQAWSNGMSHCDSPQMSEVAQTSGLTVAQVKNWIGNYRRKVSGHPPTRKRLRQPSGYNLFCREMASKMDEPLEKCSKEIGLAWTSLPKRKKQQYIEKARQETMSPPNIKEKIRKSIKQLDSCTLNSLGVHGFGAIVVPGSSEYHLKGTTRGIRYIAMQKQIATEFMLSLQKPEVPDSNDGKQESKRERETLRRQVQDLFNQKYKEVHGPEAKLSYKKGAELEGLPNGLKLCKPSGYGLPSLKAILSASAVLKFKKMDRKRDEDSNKKAVAVPSTAVSEVLSEMASGNSQVVEEETTPVCDLQFLQSEAEKVLCEMASGNFQVFEETTAVCELPVLTTTVSEGEMQRCEIQLVRLEQSEVHSALTKSARSRGKKRKTENELQKRGLGMKKERFSKIVKGEDSRIET